MNHFYSHHNLKFQILCILLILFISTGGYLTGIKPVIENTHASIMLKYDLNLKNNRLNQIRKNLTQKKIKLSTLTQKVKANQIRLKSKHALNQQIAKFTRLAQDSGVIFEQVKPGKIQPGKHYQLIPITVQGVGTYRSCTTFFYQIHKQYNDMGIASFEIKGDPSHSDGQASFTARLHWFSKSN